MLWIAWIDSALFGGVGILLSPKADVWDRLREKTDAKCWDGLQKPETPNQLEPRRRPCPSSKRQSQTKQLSCLAPFVPSGVGLDNEVIQSAIHELAFKSKFNPRDCRKGGRISQKKKKSKIRVIAQDARISKNRPAIASWGDAIPEGRRSRLLPPGWWPTPPTAAAAEAEAAAARWRRWP